MEGSRREPRRHTSPMRKRANRRWIPLHGSQRGGGRVNRRWIPFKLQEANTSCNEIALLVLVRLDAIHSHNIQDSLRCSQLFAALHYGRCQPCPEDLCRQVSTVTFYAQASRAPPGGAATGRKAGTKTYERPGLTEEEIEEIREGWCGWHSPSLIANHLVVPCSLQPL